MKLKLFFVIVSVAVALMIGILIGYIRGIPFIAYPPLYAIGMYSGDSPLTMDPLSKVQNPVISAKDITDIKAGFTADPFMIKEGNKWYMFFEIMNDTTGQGDIGMATSKNLEDWKYQQVVLDEPYHLSYPYVFKYNNEIYLMPESSENYDLRLYRAKNFPTEWQFERVLLKGNYIDSSIIYYNNLWWIFTSDRDDMLHLFYADSLESEWHKHPASPLIDRNKKIARSSGRIISYNDKLYRFTQDCSISYGIQVRAFRIDELSPTSYKESSVKENPVLTAVGGSGWNSRKMHHIDAHFIDGKWIACVDGIGPYLRIGLDL